MSWASVLPFPIGVYSMQRSATLELFPAPRPLSLLHVAYVYSCARLSFLSLIFSVFLFTKTVCHCTYFRFVLGVGLDFGVPPII